MTQTYKPGDRVVIESPTPQMDGKRGTVLKAERDSCTVQIDSGGKAEFWLSKLTSETEYDERRKNAQR